VRAEAAEVAAPASPASPPHIVGRVDP